MSAEKAVGWTAEEGSEFDPRQGQDFLLFMPFRPVLRPVQSPLDTRALLAGKKRLGREADRLPPAGAKCILYIHSHICLH